MTETKAEPELDAFDTEMAWADDLGEMLVNRYREQGIERVIVRCYTENDSINHLGFTLMMAVLHHAYETGTPMGGVMDRGEEKDHGTGKRFEGKGIIPGRTVYL